MLSIWKVMLVGVPRTADLFRRYDKMNVTSEENFARITVSDNW